MTEAASQCSEVPPEFEIILQGLAYESIAKLFVKQKYEYQKEATK